MARFTLSRDIKFFEGISRELVDVVIETAVVLYKLVIEDSKTNLYGESLNKTYYQGVQTTAMIEREPGTSEYEGFGSDTAQNVEFRFNKERLRTHEIPKVRDINGNEIPADAIQNTQYGYPEIGDIILFDEFYGH